MQSIDTKRVSRGLLLVAALCAASCGSSDDGATTGATMTDGGKSSLVAGSEDIVINELSAVGTSEWFELANKGSAAFDLGGYGIADSDKTTGKPKTSDAVRFPSGTKLEPGGRIVVLTSKKDQPVGPYDKAACLPEGPASCFYAGFGISATNGESTHFLAPDDTVISTTAYPRSVTIDPATNKTACRLPDLTGPFALCNPTPGGVNAAP
jgi:hypothetical protein